MIAITLESSNILGLFDQQGNVLIDKTCEFLDLSKEQIANAFGLNKSAIRIDRLSQSTKDRFYALAEAMEKVALLLDKDRDKTKAWFKLPNPNFGGASPRSLIIHKRYDVVLKFIDAATSGF